MTREEAIEILENGMWWELLIPITTIEGRESEDKLHQAIDIAIAALTHPTGWISVEDRIPKTGTVLATDGRVVITAPASSVTADGPAITYWMPLPDLPGKGE